MKALRLTRLARRSLNGLRTRATFACEAKASPDAVNFRDSILDCSVSMEVALTQHLQCYDKWCPPLPPQTCWSVAATISVG